MDFRIGGNANIDIAQVSQSSDQFERRRVTIDPEQESDIKLCPERSVIGDMIFHHPVKIIGARVPGIDKKWRVVKIENSRITRVGVFHATRVECHLVIVFVAGEVTTN